MSAPAAPAPRKRSRKAFWLKQLHTWHWMSSAVSLIGLLLFAIIGLFALARRNDSVRDWITRSRAGAIAETFLKARPLDYAIVLGIKAPSFLASVATQYFALALYGITIPFIKLMLFLPLVFLAAALPISVAHLGTSPIGKHERHDSPKGEGHAAHTPDSR